MPNAEVRRTYIAEVKCPIARMGPRFKPQNRIAAAKPEAAAMQSLIESIPGDAQPKEKQEGMPIENFDADIVVIGSGPGGYVDASRDAQVGAKTHCLAKRDLGV